MPYDTFNCPSCNAALEYEKTGAPTVRCSYCDTTVIVPQRLRDQAISPASGEGKTLAEIGELLSRGRKIEAIKVYREAYGVGLKEAKEAVEALQRGEAVPVVPGVARANPSRGNVGCILAIVALLLVGAFVFRAIWPTSRLFALLPSVPGLTPFASETLTIGGEEGTGPGFFMDTRWLGVDGDGFIYTGDFDGGRIQRFDPDGRFDTQWFTGSRVVSGGMVVDRAGTVHVLEQGRLFRYEGATGDPLGQLGGDARFDDIVLAADGDLLAIDDGRLLRFGPDGSVQSEVPDLFATLPADTKTAALLDMAVDGENNLYLLFAFDEAIYKFGPDGRYVDRFGQEGDGPGDFTATRALAVDGRGRIFVEDFSQVIVFDTAGRYEDQFGISGVAFTLLFDADNNLYRMDRNGNQVIKYELLE